MFSVYLCDRKWKVSDHSLCFYWRLYFFEAYLYSDIQNMSQSYVIANLMTNKALYGIGIASYLISRLVTACLTG